MAHGVEKCVHGVVVRQCRCVDHGEVRIVACDPKLCAHVTSAVSHVPVTLPQLNDRVHYVAFGTPGGEYRKACRAAIVTEVGQWVTVYEEKAPGYDRSEGRLVRTLEQWFYDDAVALFVMNPTGVFLNGAGPVACSHVEPTNGEAPPGGTWHWPDHG